MNDKMMSGEIVVDIYKKMLELQSSNHNTAVTILLAMAGLLIGATWFWNKFSAEKFIENEIQNKLMEQAEKTSCDINENIKQTITKELQEHKVHLKKIEAEVYRSIALHAGLHNQDKMAIRWWSRALAIWMEIDNDEMIRQTVDNMKVTINACLTPPPADNIKITEKDEILRIISQIPSILNEEKKFIMNKIRNHFIDEEV